MTTTDWRALPPGRELDAIVAERVMGLTVEWRSDPSYPYVAGEPEISPMHHVREFGSTRWKQVDAYSSRIAAAWLAMDWMVARGLRPSLCLWDDGRWICDGHWDGLHGDQSADTAPHAVVRAALTALDSETRGEA